MAVPRKLTWLITGCSSGFGHDLAEELLSRGDNVVATARNGLARLGNLKAQGASVLDLDVTWPQDKITAVVKEGIAFHGGIDVLVNNAGFVQVGIMEEIPLSVVQDSIECITYGAVKMMRAVLPHFREKKSGTIVTIGSLYGFVGLTASTAYSGAKFGLEGIIECADFELAPLNIENIIFEPGWFRTQMAHPNNIRLAQGSLSAYDEARGGANAMAAQVHGHQPGDPRKAVKRIADVVRREGVAQGKTSIPLRVPLGPDGFDAVRQKCLNTLKVLDEWESALADTNVDE